MKSKDAPGRKARIPAWAAAGVLVLLGLNVLAVFAPFADSLRSLGLGFPARTAVKPLLLFNAAVILALVSGIRPPARVRGGGAGGAFERLPRPVFLILLVLVSGAAYLPSLAINFQHQDWTHRHVSAGLTSAGAFAGLFSRPAVDGMYRPLTFVSLWADYAVFGTALWGYHLQSILLHIVNAALAGLLATRLGFQRGAARLASLLFGSASIHIEAVVWPAARFDLLSAMFTLLSLVCFLEFWRTPAARPELAAAGVASFCAAVLSKETGYATLLAAAAITATPRTWRLDPARRGRALRYLAGLAAGASVLFAIRWALYGGIRGYTDAHGQSIHTAIGLKAAYQLLIHTLPGTLAGINLTAPSPPWPALVTAAFAAAAACVALTSVGGRRSRTLLLAGLAAITALPAISVIGWIQPSLMHTRHLYLPSVWMALLLAACMRRRCPGALAAAFVGVQIAALVYDQAVWRGVILKADRLAEAVARDARTVRPARPTIAFLGLPEHLDGVLYFGPELRSRVAERLPDAVFVEPGKPANLKYRWTVAKRGLAPYRGSW